MDADERPSAAPRGLSSFWFLFRSGYWLNLSNVVTAIFSFGISIVFANALPKETYGTYQYLLSLLALFTAFSLTGMNPAITRAVAQGRDGALRQSLRPQILWSLFATAAAAFTSLYYLHNQNLPLAEGILAIGIALPVLTTLNSYSAYLIGKRLFRHYFLYSTLASIIYYAGILAAVLLTPYALPLLVTNLALTAVGSGIAFWMTWSKVNPAAPQDDGLIGYGKHLSVMNLFWVGASQIDSLLVFHFLGPVDLAIYSIATLIPEKLSGFLKNTTTSLLPQFAERSFANAKSSLPSLAGALTVFIAIASVGYAFVLPYFFRLVYPEYLSSVPYSQVFFLTLFAAVGNLVGTALLAHRSIKRLYIINLVTPALQIVLQIIGIFWFGLWGLVIARVIASILVSLITIPIVLLHPAEPAHL